MAVVGKVRYGCGCDGGILVSAVCDLVWFVEEGKEALRVEVWKVLNV